MGWSRYHPDGFDAFLGTLHLEIDTGIMLVETTDLQLSAPPLLPESGSGLNPESTGAKGVYA